MFTCLSTVDTEKTKKTRGKRECIKESRRGSGNRNGKEIGRNK
jgi:hypothetical protein